MGDTGLDGALDTGEYLSDDAIGDGTVMGTKIGVGGSFPALNLDAGRLAARAFLGGISQAIAVRNVVNPLFLIVALTDFIQLRL